ncbi:MAG: TraB/GumN family protein [Chitinophagaceae bacterium]|nr:TraB/GumN family protein [Chitinophagaceae bacterium]
MRSLLVCITLIIFLSGCKAQQKPALKIQPDNNTLLWQVSGKELTKPSYLFGTFHLLCRDDINFSAQLKSSLMQADEIYMEMKMDDPAVLLGGLFYMNMKNNKTLESLYTPVEYKKINNYFTDTLHTPLTMLGRVKPYFLVALLYPKMMPCKTISGVEEELMKLAKEDKKEIKGLETIQFQSSVFDSIPYEWQAKELLKNIDSSAFYKNEFDTMLLVYKQQKLDDIQKLFTKSEFGDDKYEDILLTQRNKNWVNQLKLIMKNESVFVAVGAGHLVGEKGLISLLRKEGYRVDPLVNK